MAECKRCGKKVFLFWHLSKDGFCTECAQIEYLRSSLNCYDQQQRFERGLYSKQTPLQLDTQRKTGTFAGSMGPYRTTLENCTCPDYLQRKYPCKHMYRLAVEMGLFDDMIDRDKLNRTSLKLEDRIPFDKAIREIENLASREQIEFRLIIYMYLYRDKKEGVARPRSNEATSELINRKFIYTVENDVEILNYLRRDQLVSYLRLSGVTGFKANSSKDNLIVWCADNIKNLHEILDRYELCVLPSPRYMQHIFRIYKFLTKKFSNELFYDLHNL